MPGGVWVDIAGEVQKTINLTYGMVASLLDSDSAVQVRCKLIDDSVGAMLSNEVRVTVDSSQPLPELPLENGTVLREAEAVENPAPAQDETPAASDNAQETPAPAPADNADSDTSAPSTEPQAPTGDTDNTAAASADTNVNADAASDANANADAPAISDDSQATPAPADNAAAPAAPAASDDQAAAPAADADAPAADAGTQPAASADTPAGAPAPAPANAAKAPANDLNNAKADLVSSPSAVMDTLPTPVDALDQIKSEIQNQETTFASDVPPLSNYTIFIKYQFKDGRQAAPFWSATVATGSTYTQDVQSPVVVGYTPSDAVVHVNASETKTYIVTYQPAEVDFTVKHYQQNVSNDEYTLVDTETKKGFTESAVGDNLAKIDYTGFYSLLYDTTTTIAADGSTVVEIYYDRYYYLMNFKLNGGYGVEPIYARYGTIINIGKPTKPGYTFINWTPDTMPKTMPAMNSDYEAIWILGEAGFTVVFWYENANDNGYSVAGTYTPANVAPDTQKKSDDYKNQSFTNRDDDHFTYNAAKAETVTVKGDGSTVLNVYFTRNTYTLTFVGAGTERALTCGYDYEHEHSDACCKYGGTAVFHWYHRDSCCKLGLQEHTHKDSCYRNDCLLITAKYQADIHSNFPINTSDGKTILWNVPDGCKSFKPETYLASINAMPGENITFTKYGEVNAATIYYYVESLAGKTGVYTRDGKQFDLYKQVKYTKNGYLTYAEEFHDITGFTQWWSDPRFSSFDQDGSTSTIKTENILCYTRNSYNLKFYNYNAYVDGKGGSVQFEAPLSSYYFIPDYPADLEKNAYVFAGWYTTAGCYEGSEADLDTMTMPASDVVLYAKWTPKFHTVKTYLTKDALDSGSDALSTWENIPHGTAVANPPKSPEREPYKFVGWFYISDTGEEKAFDFSMPVNRDLNLYAKWSSNTLMAYTVRYAIENADGTLTYIAADTTGSALAGTTKTFNAKTGSELNVGYQSGYFPKVSSHSITLDIEGDAENKKNEYTFVYEAKNEVTYTVKYLEKGTEKKLADPKTVITRDAVVTETFKQIEGYAPDAYQKQLVLAAENNEIIFWYVKDDAHAPVYIIHWTQNIEGNDYTERQSSTNLNGVIGTEYSETPLNIAGFRYNANPANPVDGYPALASGKLTEAGLVLNLYYDRIEYPYEFRFLEQGTDKKLAEPISGNARYQAQVVQRAPSIPGYTLVSAENQAINIDIEDSNTAVKNVKTFYYTEQVVDIKYEIVGPENCGMLDNYQDNGIKAKTGEAKGSTPTAKNGFKFVGWYKDEACTQAVDTSWIGANNKLTPKKNANGMYEAATYYAKFEYDITDLTISKKGCADIDENQSFIFTITGGDLPSGGLKVVIHGESSVTVKGLKVGTTYTVTEDDGWSWRYTPKENAKSKNITLTADATKNKLEFINVRTATLWLNGCSYKDNQWANKN